MDFISNADTILKNRAFLLESCHETIRDIHDLKPTPKSDTLQLLSRLRLTDDTVSEFTGALLDRGAKLDVTDVVGALSDKLNAMYTLQDDDHLSEKRKKDNYTAAMDAMDNYFREIDRIEKEKAPKDLNASNQTDQQQSVVVSDASVANHAGKAGECDYELIMRLTGQWGKWTGNVPTSADMHKLIPMKGRPTSSEAAERIKIPFKPSMWLKGGRLKRIAATDGNANLGREESTDNAASPEAMHPPAAPVLTLAASAANLGLEQVTQHQVTYGATRYEPQPESTYWANLTLTECLMASPYFQHLSSDKFRALDHFAVVRTYTNQETILEQHQKFYSVFFIRHGAVKVLKPFVTEADPTAPEAVLQVLQSGDFFGFECTSSDLSISSARFHYQALGDNVECYAIPVEYFVDICLKDPLSHKSAPVKVNMNLECDHTAPDAAQVSLATYALALQETRVALRALSLGGSILSAAAKAQHCVDTSNALLRFDQLVNPELEFAEVLDDLLSSSREVLNVDRACLYLIDRVTASMRFYGVPAAAQRVSYNVSAQGTGGPVQSVSVGDGIVSSLGGIIDHVVQHACTLNIANFGSSEYFDPSIEKRTGTGKRIKHLLLVPVFDLAGHVISVMQYSNTRDRDGFTAVDVQIAESIASRAALIKMSALNTVFTPVHALPADCLTFRLDHLVMPQTNRHLKGSVQLYVGNQPYGPAVATASVATYPIMGDLHRADFKQDIAFRNLSLSDLPVTTKIVFSFESTNHHPIVWCGMYLFDYLRRLQKGDRNIVMWDAGLSADPRDLPSVLEGLPYAEVVPPAPASSPKTKKSSSGAELMQSSRAVLTICLQDHQATVLHMSPGVVKYSLNMGLNNPAASNPLPKNFAVTPVPLAPGASAVDWYLRQLLPTELNIFMALKKIVDVISPGDIDAETSRLVWRMRNALCAESPWAMPWFLLCCDWTHKMKVEEAHRLLYSWSSVTPLLALQLLDSRFRDPKVRAFAVGVIGQLPEAAFQNCLFQLVYCLRFETHCDCALARLLLRRALANPNSTGKQMLWYLHSMFAREPVAYAQAQRLLKMYLRSIPDEDRAHQGHGLYAMQRIDAIYRGIASSNLFPPHRPPEPEQVVEVLLSELNQNPWPSEFTVPTPVSQELYTTGVVQCKKLPHIPHSFMLALKYTDQPAGRILYSHAIDIRTEMLYQHMLRAVNLVWLQEGVQLTAMSYEAFVIGGTGAIVQNVVPEGKPIVALAAATSEHEPTSGWGASFSTKAKAVSETLLEHFFSALSVPEAGSNKPSPQSAKAAFVQSLAVFVIVNQVLGLRDVTLFNVVLTPRGDLFVQNPTSVLGYEHHSVDAKKASKSKTDTLFYMRCFENVLGAADSAARRDFVNQMSVAFLSLRKHVTLLLWALGNITYQLGIPAPQAVDCTDILKEKLLLSLNDEAALDRLRDILHRSMKSEPTVSAVDAANVSLSMKH